MDKIEQLCQVCGDNTDSYQNYGVVTCSSCRVFFRRQINKVFIENCLFGNCKITKSSRKICTACRFKKCLAVGMDPKRVNKRKKAIECEVNCSVTC